MRRSLHESLAWSAIAMALISCGPVDTQQTTAFSRIEDDSVAQIFAATRNTLKIESPLAFVDPQVWEGPQKDVSTLAGQKACGFARTDVLAIASDEPEHCPQSCTISHEYGHWLSFALYGDFDYGHQRWGEYSAQNGWWYAFPFKICKR